jgi:hypothetical protein
MSLFEIRVDILIDIARQLQLQCTGSSAIAAPDITSGWSLGDILECIPADNDGIIQSSFRFCM